MTEALSGQRLAHDAIPYGGQQSYVTAVVDLLRAARRDGDVLLVLAVGTRVDELRATLGPAARGISFIDLSVRGRNPARVLPALRSFLEAHAGRRARIIAEPVHTELTSAELAETVIAELVLGRPEYGDWDARICCLYDAQSLDGDALSAVRTGHPDDPAAAAAALRAAFRQELPAAPASARSCTADMTTLGLLRGFVREGVGDWGLDGERSDDLVYAVNEVVTNSICHGEGRAVVSLWAEPRAICCQVRDKGRIDDVLVGRLAPRPAQATGRGLWLVNQLCDLVQVRSSPAGTVVRMIVDR